MLYSFSAQSRDDLLTEKPYATLFQKFYREKSEEIQADAQLKGRSPTYLHVLSGELSQMLTIARANAF